MEDMRKFWDDREALGPVASVFDPNDSRGHKFEYVSLVEKKAISKALSDMSPASTILDFGCGTGNLIKMFSDSDYRFTGVDISINMLKYCHRHLLKKPVLFVQYDGESLPFPNNSFDVCVTNGVLVYLSKTEQFLSTLKEINRVLKPGGRLIASEHTRRREVYQPKRMKFLRSSENIIKLISRAGFCLKESRSFRRGHFPLIYLIRYGFVHTKMFPYIARLESLLGKVFGQPFFDYADTIFIAEKPSD